MVPLTTAVRTFEHQLRSSRRPTHLLVGAHPSVQQPLHRTIGGRCRYRLTASPGGDIIDDQTGLPGYVSLEATKHTPVDGERDRLRFARRTRRWRCYGVAFQSGADAHRPLADRLDFRGVPEREELFEQRAGAAVRQQGAHLGEGALILRRAAIRHDLRGRGDGPARRHAASAGTKTACTNLHDTNQQRPSATSRLYAANLAVGVDGELLLVPFELRPVDIPFVVILQQNLPFFQRLAVAVALAGTSVDDLGPLLAFCRRRKRPHRTGS